MTRSFAFAFTCSLGDLEIRTAFLAASLARSLRCRHELIAVIRKNAQESSPPKTSTLAFLNRLGVRIVEVESSPDLDPSIGLSVECLRVATAFEKLVLVGTSQLLLRDFADYPRFSIAFNACCALEPPAGDESAWRAIYHSCQTHAPMTRGYSPYTGQYFPLCFDPGFVAVPANISFGDAWLQCSTTIRQAHPLQSAADLQKMSLSVAAKKLGLEIDVLEERFGHPTWLRPIDDRDPPFFARYDDPANIAREPALLRLVADLLREYPDLRAIAAGDPKWDRVAAMANSPMTNITPGDPLAPELIITGIPRSGTSYLCNLLHRMSNCVILNEPPEGIPILRNTKSPLALANFLRDRRRDVLAGVPIANKLEDGQITQDTAKSDKISHYSPQVASANFVLGMKETLPFLTRLPMLRQILPNARFVVCVRDPLDTLASWKGSFPHLNIAEVVRQPVGNPIDPWLTVRQQQELRAIAAVADPSSRRAAWWAYLANLILQSRDHLIIIRYEDLVTNPQQALSQILQGWPAGRVIRAIEPSAIRRRRHLLTADDVLAVRSLCAEPARALGLLESESQAGE